MSEPACLAARPAHFGPRRSGIIFAADLPGFAANARVLERIADRIDVIKVNCPLLYTEGIGVISRLTRGFGLPVFADLKVADVPHTDRRIVELVREQGGAALMVHGIVGPDALAACQEAAGDALGIVVQLELTHPGGRVFTAPLALDMATLAASLGLFGVQAPGNRPERIRAIRQAVGPAPVVVCCGVGRQGGSYAAVMAAGGSYAIVGRAIYQAEQPRLALDAVLAG
ncbi:MAG: orotidine-5'-phosphate decarboxylase [Deltaproteobacteria bacterium]|nr:orotidine-5'-phosphate decarboxylase [Deltaproteobacteria bacterium]